MRKETCLGNMFDEHAQGAHGKRVSRKRQDTTNEPSRPGKSGVMARRMSRN